MAAAVGSGWENGRRSAGIAGLRIRLKPIAREYPGVSPVAGDGIANQPASPIAESALRQELTTNAVLLMEKHPGEGSRMHRVKSRTLSARSRLPHLAAMLALIAGVITSFAPSLPVSPIQTASAHHTDIRLPVPSGEQWSVLQGYNTSPAQGGSHYSCDSATLTDQPSHTTTCSQYWQYKYSLDLVAVSGATSGRTVISPVTGTIRWIDQSYGGMSIDLGDGYAFAFFHVDLASSLAAGQAITQGQRLGTVASSGNRGNGGTPHIHVTLWKTTDGGNWSRIPEPFTGDHALNGVNLPALADSSRNQYQGQTITSSNSTTSTAATAPAVPTLATPANGTTYWASSYVATVSWGAVTGATSYQVVINDGAITSPWVNGTSWTTGSLTPGQYAWQVKSRNANGESALSAKWVFWVEGTTLPTPPTTPQPLGVKLESSSGAPGLGIWASGGGMNASEKVDIYLDQASGTVLATATANSAGNWSVGISIPDATGGAHKIVAKGQTSAKSANAGFTVKSALTRSPYQGPPGTPLSITVKGFGANETVKLSFIISSGNTVTLGNATTNASGTGTISATMPEAPFDWHDYQGVGQTSGLQAFGAFYVTSGVTLSSAQGSSGASVTLTAKGFSASDSVRVGWNQTSSTQGTTLCTGTTSSNGSFNCTFTVPQSASGAYPIVVTASNGPTNSATFAIAGAASVSLTPNSGNVGEPFQISTGGFQAGEAIALTFDGGTTWQSATASSAGAALINATIPFAVQGAHTIAAKGGTSGKTASASLTVSPSMSVTPNGGATGTSVTAYVRGMKASQSVSVRFNSTSSSTGTSVCTGTTNGSGSYQCTFSVPSVTNGNTYSLYAGSGSFSASSTFTATATGGVINGGTMLGEGTYQVTATQEGLVGGTTSNGHTIVPNDHFVSLPACTPMNCDWLAGGSTDPNLGYVTNCGSNCYVRVTNPDTGICRVEPVWDTGPWFTNDNWWEPTERRNLNNLGSTVNILGQGYTGADAAKDGLNVGYGLSSGVGVSNKGYQVGNRAAIDIADGTWVDIGFNDGSGPETVIVSMLWQTGESVSAAKNSCLGGATIVTPRISISPTSGSAGSAVTVTGSGYNAGETIDIYWDTTTGTMLATITANSAGSFTKSVTIPSNASTEAHLIVGKGRTSGAKPSRTFTVAEATPTPTPVGTPKISIAPLSGQVGASVVVTGSGYTPSEPITIYWDSTVTGTVLGTATANSQGGFSVTVTIPSATTGTHLIVGKGSQSGAKPSRSFTVLPKTKISLAPTSGPVNTSVNVTAIGYSPGETVEIRWKTSNGTVLASGTADSSGAYSATIRIPNETAGGYYVVGRGATSGLKATRTFTISGSATPTPTPTSTATPKPAVSISPRSGTVGSTVQVTGSGYGASEQVQIYWDSTGSSGKLLKTVTANSSGAFSTSVTVPTALGGNHLIVGKGVTSGSKPSRTYVVTQSSSLSTSTGKPGDSVTVNLRGFQSGEPVSVYWDSSSGPALLTLTASSTGSGLGTFTIPSTVNGPHQVVTVGSATATSLTTPFTISGASTGAASVTLSPNAGGGGGGIASTASGANFWSQETVQLFWGANTSPSATGTSGPDGKVSISFNIPTVPGGAYPITLKGVTSGSTATASYTVQPRLEFTPPIGEVGATIKIDVKGWASGQVASVYWNRTSSSNGTLLCSATGRTSGTASCSFQVPSGFPAGTDVPVMAVGSPGSVSGTFRVTNSPVGFAAEAVEETATPSTTVVAGPDTTPSPEPDTDTPSSEPTDAATEVPTQVPTEVVTEEATEVPTEIPTEVPTEAPTEVPTEVATEAPQPWEVVAYAASDVTVYSAKPDEQPSPDLVGQLTAGGLDGSAAYITFSVEGVGGAQVIDAQLVLTSGGPSAAGSLIGIIPDYWVDEASAVYSTLPSDGISAAVDATGNPAYLPPAGPGEEIWLNVTGSIAGDGTYTFVVTGTPDALAILMSREAGVPARLVLTVQ